MNHSSKEILPVNMPDDAQKLEVPFSPGSAMQTTSYCSGMRRALPVLAEDAQDESLD